MFRFYTVRRNYRSVWEGRDDAWFRAAHENEADPNQSGCELQSFSNIVPRIY